jgi:geranyl-CoA carboxylase alpha subunit
MSRFESILVANRGEIALRVMRTARAMGYRTIAVYSEADAEAPHVRFADDACLIGPAPAAESYLHVERLLQAAAASGAGAVHPGYGFLSENAAFARAVADAGLVFIGPPADAIELMGNKAAAKRRMRDAGVPCVPGYEGREQDDATLAAAAGSIGYPVMVKAAAGGGGRGMRLVRAPQDLSTALHAARAEARNAFGSDELILEKALECPRHVEFQVFADEHGHVIHLGERDCSVQRRHQKVVEEAPCPVMTPELRARMGAAAVEAARSIGYRGAGTIEFLLDADGSFYFLEMNTRLQVEHPVTELTTGIDLVALQLDVAEGRPLALAQEDVRLQGHAIEVRLYAEDPARDFLPATGRILRWRPASGPGVRIDGGIAEGQLVSPYYDPMLAKVIAWAETREQAIDRLVAALSGTQCFGPATNRGFLVDVLQKPAFRRGTATTGFIAEEFPEGCAPAPVARDTLAIAAVLQFVAGRDTALGDALARRTELLNWSSRGTSRWHARYRAGDATVDAYVAAQPRERYEVGVDGATCAITVLERDGTTARLEVAGRRRTVAYAIESPDTIHVADGARTHVLRNLIGLGDGEAAGDAGGRVCAHMHGTLVEVFVQPGERVERGSRLALLEAMKMQHEIRAESPGAVVNVSARPGMQVAAGDLLFEIETAGESA